MGRTATKPQEPVTDVVLNPTAVATIEATQDALAVMAQSYAKERDLLNQLLGQAQMADSFAKFSKTVFTSKLAFVKENKLYQALKGNKGENGIQFSGTWEEFCNALGWTPQHANDAIASLNAFGEEALESMNRMGIGYRELRQYRKLPEDQKQALLEVAKAGDKGEFLDLAEELIAKHAKEKKEAEDTRLQLEADNKFLADKRDKETQRADKAEKALQSGPRTRPLSERLATFAADVDKASNAASEALIQLGQQIQALEQWWLEEAVQLPGYDPERVTPMPPEVLAVAQKLHDGVQSMALAVGHLQNDVQLAYGDEVAASRTHLLQSGAAAQAE